VTTQAPPLGPAVTAPRIYYFGCGTRAGHGWFKPAASMQISAAVADAMRTVFPDIDCNYAPDDTKDQVEGEAKLSHLRGWTVLAWWDRSVDTRRNANSALVIDADRDFDQMVDLLEIHFPQVLWRQRVPFKLVPQPVRP
jgi:hypothetical protein